MLPGEKGFFTDTGILALSVFREYPSKPGWGKKRVYFTDTRTDPFLDKVWRGTNFHRTPVTSDYRVRDENGYVTSSTTEETPQ